MSLYQYFLTKEVGLDFLPRVCLTTFLKVTTLENLNDYIRYSEKKIKASTIKDYCIIVKIVSNETKDHKVDFRKKEDDRSVTRRLSDVLMKMLEENERDCYSSLNIEFYIIEKCETGKSQIIVSENYINLINSAKQVKFSSSKKKSKIENCNVIKYSKKILDIRASL
jgi:competence CoiA-like predicted nuclease